MKALISVSDKTNIIEFCDKLRGYGVEIVSTGGTYAALTKAGIPAMEVADLTGFPECLDGRVKTLHPKIHAGILARRDDVDHMGQLEKLGVDTIDFVVVNLYPFKETIMKDGVSRAEVVENIDIGGPTMLRSAAKNYPDVCVLTDPADYDLVLNELSDKGSISLETKFYLMKKVFVHTAHYDAMIADYLKKEQGDNDFGETLTLTYEKVADMRYGENPHQKAAFYREVGQKTGSLTVAKQLSGKELSFNNINDANGALELLKEFSEAAVVACKHGNPCGVGEAANDDIIAAWRKAHSADTVSIFGGIVVLNRKLSIPIAEDMKDIFLEVIIAPSYEDRALEILSRKKNVRILELPEIEKPQAADALDMKKINGGLIVQSMDAALYNEADWRVVTKVAPSDAQIKDMIFGMKIVKYVKSNGIALVKEGQSIGIGPGQVNRIWAAKQSVEHAGELIGPYATKGAVLASDAFFPFPDVVHAAYEADISAIIQPGGSLNDEKSIAACNERGIAMVFTGMRHFRH